MKILILLIFIFGFGILSFWAGYEMRSSAVPGELEEFSDLARGNSQHEIDEVNERWRATLIEMATADAVSSKDQVFGNLDSSMIYMDSDIETVRKESSKMFATNFMLMKLSLESWSRLGIDYDPQSVNRYVQRFKSVDSSGPPGITWADFRDQLINDVEDIIRETQQVDREPGPPSAAPHR